ncbi:MAG: hypothetical protein IT204_06620 [Fimbriimonadaceae bacterium]|nr:hypothetical protein [Fimbriimonadaceae bacterium]
MTTRRAWLAALQAAAQPLVWPSSAAAPLAATAEALRLRLLAAPADRESWQRLAELDADRPRWSAAIALAALGGTLPAASARPLPAPLEGALRGPLDQRGGCLDDLPAGLQEGDRRALALAVSAATGDLEAWHRGCEELPRLAPAECLPSVLREALGARLEHSWRALLSALEADLGMALGHRQPTWVAAALEAQRQVALLLDSNARLAAVRQAALRAARQQWRESDGDRWRRGALLALVAWWAAGDLQAHGASAAQAPVSAALAELPRHEAQCWTPRVTSAPAPDGPLPTWPWSLLQPPVEPWPPAPEAQRWVVAWERARAGRGCPEDGWQALLSGLLGWLHERAAAVRQELGWRWREALLDREVPRPTARS